MSVISSSNISKKVSRILEILSPQSHSKEGGGDAKDKGKGKVMGKDVVMLYAKAPVACKLVSIVEIVKREVAKEGGKWFAYCGVGEVVAPRAALISPPLGKEKKKGSGHFEDSEGGGEGEREESAEEEAFEVMKTPFERALESEARPKVRAMPVMSLYLSRGRIESLRIVYGEQTNAQEIK
ncbi:hypothetical protein VTL71DRAFT_12844 [Oculimacula yallundae]|uniref:DNA/RNA-binding protein Alba-like domain-containing protein n=1 Tax=Oculimacula yallundae TaxID=86028 RepID=A0ABR4CP57_9HELO